MKKIMLLIPLTMLAVGLCLGQSAGDYRSAATGNWNSTSTWEFYNGTAWVSATSTPTSASGVITIRSGHTVTVTADVTIDQTNIEAGGQLIVSATATLSTNDGADAEITVAGTILHQGSVADPMYGSGILSSGGTYIHNTGSSATRMASFFVTKASNSTWIYRGSESLTPAVSMAGQTYGNLTFESTSGSWSFTSTGSSDVNINGDFSLGSGVTFNAELSSVMTFAGDFTINGILNNSTNTQNYTFTGSGKTIGGSGVFEFETWNINSGASITLDRNISIASGFTGTVSGTLNCGAYTVSGAGNFTLAPGGTLGIGSAQGISISEASGNIQVGGARMFSKSANYTYNASVNQNCGDGLPDTLNNLTVAVTDTLNLYVNCIVNGTLTLTNGVLAQQSNNYLGITQPIAGNASNYQPVTGALLYVLGTAPGIVLPAMADSLGWLYLDNPNGLTLSGDLFIVNDALYLKNGVIHANGHAVYYLSYTGIDYCGDAAQTTSDAEFTTVNGPAFLRIENANGVSLHADRLIPGYVDFFEGVLSTGSNTLTLGPEAFINENDSSYVLGKAATTRVLTNDPETFGGLGLELQAAGAEPGATTVTRTTGTAIVQGSVQSIKRYFHIEPTNNTGLNAQLVFYYLNSELNGLNEEDLALFRSPDLIHWGIFDTLMLTLDTVNNTATATGIDSFSYWTLGDKKNPLAVELSSFSALGTDLSVTLSWRTESENGSYQWLVERSERESGPFVELGRLPAAGTSQVPRDYSWSDMTARAGVTNYYRIGELSQDGRLTYFGPVSCSLGRGMPQVDLALGCAPNPFRSASEIRYQLARTSPVSVAIYNVSGQLVRRLDPGLLTPGYYQVKWDGTDQCGRKVSAGIYLYRISIGGRQFGGKVQLVR